MVGAGDGWTRPVTTALENIIIIPDRNLQYVGDEIPSKLQGALFRPFFREVLDSLGSPFHRVVQRVDLRFVFCNNRLPSGSQFRCKNKRLLGGRDQDHLFRRFG